MESPEFLIRGEIERHGPIPFARFMELALYHPEHGYYASGRASIGRRGDFSNELFDSLPVHLIVSGGVASGATDWKEKFVTVAGDNFALTTANVSRSELRLDQLGFFPADFETEVNVAAPKLMGEIASKLSCGVILTIDYGFVRAEFYSLDRSRGSLQVRAKQKKLSSSFEQIGLADISAHVEWTGLAEAALSAGAKPIGFTDQHHFLTGIVSKFFSKVEFSA